MSRSSAMPRIYIGRLGHRIRESDVERFFKGFGKIVQVDLKNGYGFVEFEDVRDADDAVYEMNGRDLCGERVIVEHTRAPRRGLHNGFGFRKSVGDKFGPPVRTMYRLRVENLSTRCSCQDLKDFMGQVGEVTFTDAHHRRPNEGVIEFRSYSDMKRALERLDGREINGRKIRLVEERDGTWVKRSTSRSRSRSNVGARSWRGSHSKSRSRSRSMRRARRSKSRSGERRPSRSVSKGRRENRSRTKDRSMSKSGREVGKKHRGQTHRSSEDRVKRSKNRSRSPSKTRKNRGSRSPSTEQKESASHNKERESKSHSKERESRSHSKERESRSQSKERESRSQSKERESRSQSKERESRNQSKERDCESIERSLGKGKEDQISEGGKNGSPAKELGERERSLSSDRDKRHSKEKRDSKQRKHRDRSKDSRERSGTRDMKNRDRSQSRDKREKHSRRSRETERNNRYNDDGYSQSNERSKSLKEVERNGKRSRSKSIESSQKRSHDDRSSSSEPYDESKSAYSVAVTTESDKEIEEGMTVCGEVTEDGNFAPTPTKGIPPDDTEEETQSVNSPPKPQSRSSSPVEP